MADGLRTGNVDWNAHREKGSGVYKLTGYDTFTGTPIELELTSFQVFTLASFLRQMIADDAGFFADYRLSLLKRSGDGAVE